VVVSNQGVIRRQLPMPGPLVNCSPVRWWTSTVILASCDLGAQDLGKPPEYASQLVEVPLDGGAPTALTTVSGSHSDSLGERDAWQLPSGTFLQSEAGCGPGFLSRLTPDMHSTPVKVPGVDKNGSVVVSGVTGDKLVLEAIVDCGLGNSVLTYDPAANTSTVLLGPPVNGGNVHTAILYPDP